MLHLTCRDFVVTQQSGKNWKACSVGGGLVRSAQSIARHIDLDACATGPAPIFLLDHAAELSEKAAIFVDHEDVPIGVLGRVPSAFD